MYMNEAVLATKLCVPILRNGLILRPELVERLNANLWQGEGFSRKLTVFSAPAGFGKTTLVGIWLRQSIHPVAWLSLDDTDNDPVRLMTYLVATLRQVKADFGETVSALLGLPQNPPAHLVLTALLNEIAALSTPFILALDDYHLLHLPVLHQNLAFILDNQPANMHLVILTREDPPLPLARLRARGQLLEIRQEDLRFTLAETAEFLHRGIGLALDPQDLAALDQHVEGWAAGLQLVSLSLRQRDGLREFLQGFNSSNRFILDYLLEEVFARLEPEIQGFLLQTAHLSRLCAQLCDAVTLESGSGEMLRVLEQANLFILPLDDAHTWYRYHHLFSELLRHRLRLSPISEEELHRRASRWYETEGLFQDAIYHALAAQNWESAMRLINQICGDLLKRGEIGGLLRWFKGIPEKIMAVDPAASLSYAWALLLAGQYDAAGPWLEVAQSLVAPGSYLLGQVAAAQAYLARSVRDQARAIEKSEQALVLLPEDDVLDRGNISFNLGLAYWHVGQMEAAENKLLQACRLNGQSGNVYALLTARIFLARVAAVRGQLRQAAASLEQVLQTGGKIPILCLAHFDLATLYYEWNDLNRAEQHLELGEALSLRSGNVEFQQSGCLLRAILAYARGDEPNTLAALAEARTLAREFPAAVRSRVAAFGVQVALARRDERELADWELLAEVEADAHSFYRFLGLTRPRVLIAKDQKQQAACLLQEQFAAASKSGWGYGMVAVRILQCLAAGNRLDALAHLRSALEMAVGEKFIRSFVDSGSAILPYLQEAARDGIHPIYVGQILAAMGSAARLVVQEPEALVEKLSERELEVLRLVTAGLSNREIAQNLVISPGTAKTHIHHVCGKLGVRNRTEAAMRAKELGLV